jgi:Na+/melibiose symporter-like transporter
MGVPPKGLLSLDPRIFATGSGRINRAAIPTFFFAIGNGRSARAALCSTFRDGGPSAGTTFRTSSTSCFSFRNRTRRKERRPRSFAMHGTQRLSVVEKVGYSLGDAAANFVFMTMILFQSAFYTDTFGLAAGVAGTLLLVGRLWDAFFDPMMGALADRTNTRWGKFRPWILWTALPWGIVMYMAYSTPDISQTGKMIYAAVTNILLMTLYSANNTPYSALSGVMTSDVNERTRLSSYRFVAVSIAQLIVSGFTLPLVLKFGQGDSARGWQMTMGLWACVCVGLFVITFLTTRERIQPDPRQQSSLRADFGDLLKNGPWIAMFVLTLAHFAVLAMRGGTLSYYFNYFLDKEELLRFVDNFGLASVPQGEDAGWGAWLLNTFGLAINEDRSNVAAVGFSLFNMSSLVVTIVGVMFSTMLAERFGKKAVAIVGFTLATLFMAAFVLLPADAVWAVYGLEWIRAAAYAPTIPLLWAMFADVADYAEWTTGRRTTGVIFATILFALKAGLSLGGAISLWLLAGYGYQANVEQSARALEGIRMIISVYPSILFGVCIACLASYKITKQLNLQIQDELAERRKAFAPSA